MKLGALESPHKYTHTECQGVIDTKVENHDSISIPERNKLADFFYKIVNSIVNFFKNYSAKFYSHFSKRLATLVER